MKKLLLSTGLFVLALIWVPAFASTWWVMPYDSGFVAPPGYVIIVNNTANPTEMVIVERYPADDNGHPHTDMLAHTPAPNYPLPTTALKNTLVTSNGTTTWVSLNEDNILQNWWNWADWVSDPVDAWDGDYELMTVDGDGQGSSFINVNGGGARFRHIYTGPSFLGYGCVNYSWAAYIGAVVLNSDKTVIGCGQPASGDEDLIPLWGIWADWVAEWRNERQDFAARLWLACDDCWMGSDGDGGDEGIPLGFTINYYGYTYDKVFVNSNGSVSFGEWSSSYDEPLNEILGGMPGVCAYCIDLENNDQIDDVIEGTTGWTLTWADWRHSDFVYRWRTTFEGRPAFAATWINMPAYSTNEEDMTWNTFQIMFVDIDDDTDDVDIIVNYGSMRNEDEQGYCLGVDDEGYVEYDEGLGWEDTNCNRIAIGLGTASGDVTIYNSIVSDSGLVLNGMRTQELWDEGDTPLNEQHLNSTVPGRFKFQMRDGALPGSTIDYGPGCTDPAAENYDANVTEEDNSCRYHVDNLAASNVTLDQMDMSWTKPLSWAQGDIGAYYIYTAPATTLLTGEDANLTGFSLTGLTQSTSYTIYVCAVYYGGTQHDVCTSIVQATTTPPSSGGGGGGGWGGGTYNPTRATVLAPVTTTKTPDPVVTTPTDKPVQPTNTEVKSIKFSAADVFNPDIPDKLCFERKNDVEIFDSSTIKTTEEFKMALTFLNSYGMTIFNNIDAFQIYEPMTRAQAAKMFSNFAMNVLCRKADDITISYTDTANVDSTLAPYIVKAYQLGLMKWGKDNTFRPNEIITKAELNAVLTRMILKSYLSEESEVWYQKYNEVATKLGIITQWAKEEAVSRHDAALMLFRAYRDQAFSLQNIDYESFVLKDRSDLVEKNK